MANNGHQVGDGLGKHGDGIRSPIKLEKTSFTQGKERLIFYVGTSMIGGVNEKKLSESTKERVKVYSHPGATIPDIKHHLHAHLRKKPTHLILQAGTNDARNREITSDDIYEGLQDLKTFSETEVPGLKVTISCPMVRTDNKWANAKLTWVKNRIIRDKVSTILNDNIKVAHLSPRSGLHLKQEGTDILSSNVHKFIVNEIKCQKFIPEIKNH